MAGTCARDRHALQKLALNVHVKHSDLTYRYPPVPRPLTGEPVLGLVVGVPEPSVDMGTLIVSSPLPPLLIFNYFKNKLIKEN